MTREEASNILDDYDVNFDGHTAEEIAEAFEVAFRALERSRWIPVSERLPEEDTNVLCWYGYFRYGNYNRIYQTYGVGTYFGRFGWAGDITGEQARVIAWMPLPTPFEPQESEGTDGISD
ncbi:MAG: DUF551 domain-containing protein [Oscillospiraceae bacterium]|nr:DUF551 domain-containing protein [Oscillospiraceae bacterium]